MLYEHYLDIAADLDRIIKSLHAHPDERVREQVAELLDRVDLLHREGLVRLADALRAAGADDALRRASADPVVRTLLGLYDLVDLGIGGQDGAVGFVSLEQLRRPRKRNAAAGTVEGQPG